MRRSKRKIAKMRLLQPQVMFIVHKKHEEKEGRPPDNLQGLLGRHKQEKIV